MFLVKKRRERKNSTDVKAQVKSLWGQGWYPGRISRKNVNGTYFIIFDDGDEVDNVPGKSIKKPEKTTMREPPSKKIIKK